MNCDIYLHSTSEHIAQLCTGFALLEQQKKITLSYKFGPLVKNGKRLLAHLNPYQLQGMFVVLDHKTVVFYDVADGENLLTDVATVVDLYFKRSYRQESIPASFTKMVLPLGLNYEVYPNHFDKLDVARFVFNAKNSSSVKQLVKCLLRNTGLMYSPTLAEMHQPPATAQSPKVLFMARTWNPDRFPGGLPEDSQEEWKQMCSTLNDSRSQIISTLRKELGTLFYGGFAADDYAVSNYPGSVLEDARVSTKKEYVRRLNDYPICIASNGLYNSIGWKFAEYVAFSKAIVSEKLHYSVPGAFLPGKNYLDFDTVDQCINQTMQLVEDKDKRVQIMENNNAYYERHLSPDQLISRTLQICAGR